MKINKKLMINMFVFVSLGVILTVSLYLLNLFNVISKDNIVLNIIIYVISAVICVSYYIYIYKKCRDTVCGKDCLIELITYVLFCVTMILLSLSRPGVHLSIMARWAVSVLSLLVYNFIYVLREKDKLIAGQVINGVYQTGKYNGLIIYMKIWVNIIFVGMFIFEIANLFIPIDVLSNMEHMTLQIHFFNNFV